MKTSLYKSPIKPSRIVNYFSLVPLFIFFAFLTSCNSGYQDSSASAVQVYTTSPFSADIIQNNCNILVSPFICNAESSSLTINISFNSNPPSYLVIPPQLPQGLTLTTTGICGNTPPASGNYSCTINIVANNVPNGSSISIPLNGSLGQQTLYNINFQNN